LKREIFFFGEFGFWIFNLEFWFQMICQRQKSGRRPDAVRTPSGFSTQQTFETRNIFFGEFGFWIFNLEFWFQMICQRQKSGRRPDAVRTPSGFSTQKTFETRKIFFLSSLVFGFSIQSFGFR
jgi:hypothetical protein